MVPHFLFGTSVIDIDWTNILIEFSIVEISFDCSFESYLTQLKIRLIFLSIGN
jgi:hypothetical protein